MTSEAAWYPHSVSFACSCAAVSAKKGVDWHASMHAAVSELRIGCQSFGHHQQTSGTSHCLRAPLGVSNGSRLDTAVLCSQDISPRLSCALVHDS